MLICPIIQISLLQGFFHDHFSDQYHYYWRILNTLCSKAPDCEPVADDLPFATYTLNVGGHSVCEAHVDGCNLAGGLCMVSPYGSYDYRKGGHLVLHELKFVLALPPGSIVFFPSALITHENIPIALQEVRRVFTAFSPSYMFQWVEEGCQQVPERTEKERTNLGEEEWVRQRKRFPHWSSTF